MVDVRIDADIIVERMAEQNVLVAGGKDWDMPTYIRISYGTDMENKIAICSLLYAAGGSPFPRVRGQKS